MCNKAELHSRPLPKETTLGTSSNETDKQTDKHTPGGQTGKHTHTKAGRQAEMINNILINVVVDVTSVRPS